MLESSPEPPQKLSDPVSPVPRERDATAAEPNGDAAAPGRAGGESARPQAFHELGDLLFAAVNVARKLDLDPELALRASTARFRGRMESALARSERAGERWSDLPTERQLAHYAAACLDEAQVPEGRVGGAT